MPGDKVSVERSKIISEIKDSERTVLYEELAEYYYLFSRKNELVSSTVGRETDYHIGNLVLLSMYFDVVFIQTASIFNTTDPFIRGVVQQVIRHATFRQMIQCGVLKIVGWGGNNPREMFEAAKSFSIDANPDAANNAYYSAIADLFKPDNIVYRSKERPDDGIVEKFRKRLEQTTIVRNQGEYKSVEQALDLSLEKTGQLVAVSFNPEIGKIRLTAETLDAVSTSFIQSWYDHLENEIPDVVTYAPMSNPIYIDHRMYIDNHSIRTFLYSPQIFASFLRGYISTKDFNKILRYPYKDLAKVKNGDWKRFSNAYHESIILVSDNIGHLEHSELSPSNFNKKNYWSSSLDEILRKESGHLDLNAFIESLALLSGVVLTIPILNPLFKIMGVLAGKDINNIFKSIKNKSSNEVSPFVIKLMKHYQLQGTRT